MYGYLMYIHYTYLCICIHTIYKIQIQVERDAIRRTKSVECFELNEGQGGDDCSKETETYRCCATCFSVLGNF